MAEPKIMGRPRKDYKQLCVKLPPAILELTSTTARALNITKATLWEQALTEYIKTHKVNV